MKKSVEKRHLFQRVILAGTLEATWVKGRPSFLWVCVCVGVGVGVCVCVCACKIHQFGRHIPVYLTYVKFLPLPSAIGPRKGHPNNFDFINLWTASLWEFCNQTMKKKLCRKQWKERAKITLSKWCPFSKGIFRWSTTVKGHPSGAPQPGCPRVCPPWAHRSYATELQRVDTTPSPFAKLWLHDNDVLNTIWSSFLEPLLGLHEITWDHKLSN